MRSGIAIGTGNWNRECDEKKGSSDIRSDGPRGWL